jgi:hypothetical protein
MRRKDRLFIIIAVVLLLLSMMACGVGNAVAPNWEAGPDDVIRAWEDLGVDCGTDNDCRIRDGQP